MNEKNHEEGAIGSKGILSSSAEFLKGVRGEARQVTWPAWNDTRKATVVVVIFTVVCAGFLGGVDFVLSRLVEWVVR